MSENDKLREENEEYRKKIKEGKDPMDESNEETQIWHDDEKKNKE